jgi:hypothetical protein
MDGPASLPAIDGHGDLGIGRRVVGRIAQNDEIGPQLADRQDVTIDVQMHANIGRIAADFRVELAHERKERGHSRFVFTALPALLKFGSYPSAPPAGRAQTNDFVWRRRAVNYWFTFNISSVAANFR